LLRSIDKKVDALVTWTERVLAVGLLIGISLNVINVFGRYLAGYALNGVDEIEIYILIWIAFLGAALVTWRGSHLRMDVLILACPPAVRWLAGWFEMIVMLVVTAFVAWQSFKYVERIYALGAVSDIAHIPTWIPHSAIAISFAAMALIVVLRGLQRIAGAGQPPVHNEAERTGS
jgi:TRAP-type C4-dicarboxylate transport system permease small subunit